VLQLFAPSAFSNSATYRLRVAIHTMKKTPDVEPRLYRRRDAARILGLSEAMCIQLERRGMLTPLRLTSVGRTVRYEAGSVQALADRLIAEAQAATA
jgi:hypothetical protein